MPAERVPALVLGTGVTALGVARVLARHGIPAWHATERPDHLRHSRYYTPPPAGCRPHRFGDDLAEWLDRFPAERAVLFPCADSLLLAASGLPPALRERFPAVLPSCGVVLTVIDKERFGRFLVQAAIPHPRTLTGAELEGRVAATGDGFESAFLKPRDSQGFFARHGVKAVRVDGEAEAARRLAELSAQGDEMVVQEYVPGLASAHLFVDGYVDRNGAVRAVFARRRLRMYPPDFGNSSYMVSLAAPGGGSRSASDVAAAGDDPVQTVRRLLSALGFVGIFSVELKRDERDGVHKVLELNARPWWYVEFAARCGVDVCRLAYLDALNRPLGDPTAVRPGRTLVYPPYDFPAWRHERARNGIPFLRWLWQVCRAEQPVWRWNDPLPGVLEATRVVGGRLRRIRRRG